MANRTEGPTRTIIASEAMVAGRSVTFSTTADTCGYTPVGGRSDGVLERDVASGDEAAIRLRTAEGTEKIMVAVSCSVGDLLYSAASGKASTVAVGDPQWIAIAAGSGDGSIIEALRISRPNQGSARVVEAHTTDDTLTNAESGSVHTSVGASGTVVLSLPAAIVGIEFYFAVGAAQELRIDPNGTETISLPSTGVPGAAGKYLTANAIGETVHLVCCSAGSWRAFGFTGTWTAEA